MRTFLIVARFGFVVAIVLAVVLWVTSYLTLINSSNPKCIGLELVEGYRIGPLEVFGLPLFGVVVVVVSAKLARGRDAKLRNLFEMFDMPVFELLSMQISFGALVAYSALFGPLAGLGLVTSTSVMRYIAVANYCMG